MNYLFCILMMNMIWPIFQESDWRLDKDKNDIRVYTRTVEGYPIREFKAESEVKSDFDAIIRLFENIEDYPEWIPDLKEAEMIQKVDDSTYYYRMVINTPFPVTDRDLVSKMKFVMKGNNKLRVEMTAVPDLIEEDDKLIRIPYSDGFWEFTRTQDNVLQVRNQFLSDPGGSVPAWIVNSFLTNNPYNTVKNLREKVE